MVQHQDEASNLTQQLIYLNHKVNKWAVSYNDILKFLPVVLFFLKNCLSFLSWLLEAEHRLSELWLIPSCCFIWKHFSFICVTSGFGYFSHTSHRENSWLDEHGTISVWTQNFSLRARNWETILFCSYRNSSHWWIFCALSAVFIVLFLQVSYIRGIKCLSFFTVEM